MGMSRTQLFLLIGMILIECCLVIAGAGIYFLFFSQ